ncbi:MAG TPA: sce7726 family protein [Candidatus Alectryocaccobium stercorigallinarum]|nr:sce7726 family protein [Candidatus Alectryocaccobium stercorigallinarum]
MLYDKDIREPLFDFLEEAYGKVRIIEEKTIGKSRADIMMIVPDAVYGVEIKSDADTYARIAGQIRDYDKYCDYNIVVAGSSHGLHIKEHVPEYWGIITAELADGKFDFYFLRRPERNPKMKLEKKLSVLWRPELARLQELNGMAKYKEKSKAFVINKIKEKVPEKISERTLARQISELLFERDYNIIEETLTEYRKGELQKKIDKESDPKKRLELMMEQKEKRQTFIKRSRQRKQSKRRKVI